MGKTVDHLQGWFRSLRDAHTRLQKKKSGDGTADFTEREQWILQSFEFLRAFVKHRPEPVKSVSTK